MIFKDLTPSRKVENLHEDGVPQRISCACLLLLALSSSVLAETPSMTHHTQPTMPSAQALIDALGLEGHVEGGFFRRTYEATEKPRIDEGAGERFSMTSIFYLLTAEGPVGHFHRNRSDIVHYFHLGDPIEYVLIHADGHLERVVMGPDPTLGHRLQLTVSGGIWKASRLTAGSAGYGLISEAVTPGFDYADMSLGVTSELLRSFPQHAKIIRLLSREGPPQSD